MSGRKKGQGEGVLTKSADMIWSMGPLWVMRAWWSMPEKPIMARRPFLTSAFCTARCGQRVKRIQHQDCTTQERRRGDSNTTEATSLRIQDRERRDGIERALASERRGKGTEEKQGLRGRGGGAGAMHDRTVCLVTRPAAGNNLFTLSSASIERREARVKTHRHAPCSRRGRRGSCPCRGGRSQGCRHRAGRRRPSRRRKTRQCR